MKVHLVDGTYELFRYFYSPGSSSRKPAKPDPSKGKGRPAAEPDLRAVRGVVASMITLLESGATHLGVATDHVVESFRNRLYGGYKTGEGIDPELFAQFHPLEEALESLGVTVWAMTEFEADDALASAAQVASRDRRVEQVAICSPDKDLAQCVVDRRVVQVDRKTGEERDAAGVLAKFGVPPESITDYLALVGDSADGFPGLSGWGAKSASTVLAKFKSLEKIPDDPSRWGVSVRGAEKLAKTLVDRRKEAQLFRTLAELRRDVSVGVVDDWYWAGPRADFAKTAARLGDERLGDRARTAAEGRGAKPSVKRK